jgi:hypothetical protein
VRLEPDTCVCPPRNAAPGNAAFASSSELSAERAAAPWTCGRPRTARTVARRARPQGPPRPTLERALHPEKNFVLLSRRGLHRAAPAPRCPPSIVRTEASPERLALLFCIPDDDFIRHARLAARSPSRTRPRQTRRVRDPPSGASLIAKRAEAAWRSGGGAQVGAGATQAGPTGRPRRLRAVTRDTSAAVLRMPMHKRSRASGGVAPPGSADPTR